MTMLKIFFDMDGTLAEYRNLILSEDDFKAAGYFSTLRQQNNVVRASKLLSEREDVEVYALTAVYMDVKAPIEEKNRWLDEIAPWITPDHRIFVPVGKNKADYIPGGIDKSCVLIDDYTDNLLKWEQSGGIGIKIMNGLNGHSSRWTGSSISAAETGRNLSNMIYDIGTGTNICTVPAPERVDISRVVRARVQTPYARKLEKTRKVRYTDRAM